jgi:hypothetical protein
MRAAVNELMSRDGVVQARGGAEEEDTDGGFAHGGWSTPYFDAAVIGRTARRDRRYLHHWRLLRHQVRCELATVVDGDASSYRNDWGGPNLSGVLGVHRRREMPAFAGPATGWNDPPLSPPLPDT